MSRLRDDIRLLFSGSDMARFALIVVLMLFGTLLELASLGAIPLFVALLSGDGELTGVGRLADAMEFFGWDFRRVSPMSCGLALGGLFLVRTVYLTINYYIQENLDEDVVDEIYTWFKEEATSDSLDEALDALRADYEDLEIRLVRIKFLCEVAN